jgi:MFS family permease
MAFYPIAFLVTAPLIGDRLNSLGRKNSLLIGILVMTLATLTFGMAGYSHNAQVFFIISMIGRIFQGVGDAMICVCIPSIIVIEFPDQQELYIGYAGMA